MTHTPPNDAGPPATTLVLGPFSLDDAHTQARLHGRALHLSQMEYRLLSWFLRHPDTCMTAEEIGQALWGRGCDPGTVQVHIHNLRRKIENDPSQPRYLRSEWGKGYIFCAAQEGASV